MTLIEAVLFISIALSLIVGGLVVFKQVQMAARVQAQVRALSAIVSEARVLYRNTHYGVGGPFNIDEVLAVSGAVPKHLIKPRPWAASDNVLRTEWGAKAPVAFAIHIQDWRGVKDVKYLAVDIYNIPTEACARLTLSDRRGVTPFSAGLMYLFYYYPGNKAEDLATRINANLPNLPNQAAAHCKARSVGGLVTIRMRFLLAVQ